MAVTIPGVADNDAEYLGSWFTIDVKTPKGAPKNPFFREISGLSIEVAVAEFTDTAVNGKTQTRRRPGTSQYGEITLKRTLSPDKSFFEWVKDIRDGKAASFRVDGQIFLHDITGAIKGKWKFTNAWPSKWSASDLDVGSDDPMIEEVTLSIETLVREQ